MAGKKTVANKTPVIVDLETTGLLVTDEITTVAILTDDLPGDEQLAVGVNCSDNEFSPGSDFDKFRDELEYGVTVEPCKDEEVLLEWMEGLAEDWTDDNVIVMHNGERYRTSFDLAFLRRRSEVYERTHPFKSLLYFDTQEPFDRERINTRQFDVTGLKSNQLKQLLDDFGIEQIGSYKDERVRTIEQSRLTQSEIESWTAQNNINTPAKSSADLDGVYQSLPGTTELEYEPFTSGEEVVEAWEKGNVTDVIKHNIADVVRTEKLFGVATRQISPNELQPKRL